MGRRTRRRKEHVVVNIPHKEKMEENKNLKEEQNINKNNQNNNQNQEKKKMPVSAKRTLAVAACLVVLLGGGNIYASSQGYSNIFFLIADKLGIAEDVFGKENILSDKDITISYKPIEISEGTLIQINSLVIKNNEAKLKIQIDETNAKKAITPLTYKVMDEKGAELCNYKSSHAQTHTTFKEELILNKYKEDNKKLTLEICGSTNEKIVELEIDLEKKEINVIGNAEELRKISEEELKQYLGAFAMLNCDETQYNKKMTENEKKMLTALLIAEYKQINVDTELDLTDSSNVKIILDKQKVHAIIESFTDLKLNENGVMDFNTDGIFNIKTYKGEAQYIYNEVGFDPTAIEVTDIAYVGGIYNVTFKFCYSTKTDKGFGETSVDDLPVYKMSIGLILDEKNEYSKYRVSSMSDVTLVEEDTEEDAKKVIQQFLNIANTHEVSFTSTLKIKEINLLDDEEIFKIVDTAERDSEGYMKTNIKYSDFKNKMMEYMTEDLLQNKYSLGYKNVDGNLWISSNMISRDFVYKIENINRKGDINKDGKITKEDVDLIARYLVGEITFNEEQKALADINGDGDITSADSVLISKLAQNIGQKGDINKDGKITKEDVDLIARYLVGEITFNEEQKALADINEDGDITSADSVLISKLAQNIGQKGDINKDGKITKEDVDLIARYLVGEITFNEEQKALADINEDGDITSADSVLISKLAQNTNEVNKYIATAYCVEDVTEEIKVENKQRPCTIEFELTKNNGKYVVSDMKVDKLSLAKADIQSFLNIFGVRRSPTGVLQGIGLIQNVWDLKDNERDEDGYLITNIEYSEFQKRILYNMTEEMYKQWFFQNDYKEVNGYLHVSEAYATGAEYQVQKVELISSSYEENTYVYKVEAIAKYQQTSQAGDILEENFQAEIKLKNGQHAYIVTDYKNL